LVNYVSQPARAAFVEVGGETKIFTTSRYNNWLGVFDIPDADFNTGPYLWGFQHGGGVVWFGQRFADTDDHLVAGANNGVVLFNKDEKLINLQGASTANRWQQMSAVMASDYTTGWLPGDVKAALLASIDQAPLIAGVVAQDDFDDGIDGWSATASFNSIVSANAGKLRVQSQPDQNYAFAYRSFTGLEVGAAYQFSIDVQINAKAALLYLGYPGSAVAYRGSVTIGEGVQTVNFIARHSTLNVQPGAYLPDADVEFDNLVVARADHDRSVNNGHLVANGTITRSPVADGAELVGYAGGGSNYLSRDFAGAYTGHSSFTLIGWYFGGTAGFWDWHETVGGGSSAAHLDTYMDPTTKNFRLVWQNRASIILQGDGPSIEGRWVQIALCFTGSGGLQFYQDGRVNKTYTTVPSAALHELRILPAGGSRMALLRLTETTPTAGQIAKIYEDERRLFMPGAQCTLYGTSDAVTALAHDPKSNLLHVGTGQGRSVFDGLQRVAHTETPVTTAIAAAGGLIVEE
jgi:hypothetical protein